jgi:phospholipase A1
MKSSVTRLAAAGSTLSFVAFACAQELSVRLEDCRRIADEHARLACYDALSSSAPAVAQPSTPATGKQSGPAVTNHQPSTPLARHWELEPQDKLGLFKFRPHRSNYFIVTYNPSPNNTPYLPFRGLTPGVRGLSEGEVAFQLGFKLKLAQDVLDRPLDFWFGYTQSSYWQAGNQKASSPFRETDYQPELMAVVPVDYHLFGLRGRFINVGFLHQSNGQASTLSRSWNRVYVQTGLERGNFSLLARVWKRINEPLESDDNPDIVNYMGYGDVQATWRRHGHEYALLTRYNFRSNKGAAQLAWAFPLVSNLKGYVQFFAGYGHTLIDYNAYQRVLGIGVQVEF